MGSRLACQAVIPRRWRSVATVVWATPARRASSWSGIRPSSATSSADQAKRLRAGVRSRSAMGGGISRSSALAAALLRASQRPLAEPGRRRLERVSRQGDAETMPFLVDGSRIEAELFGEHAVVNLTQLIQHLGGPLESAHRLEGRDSQLLAFHLDHVAADPERCRYLPVRSPAQLSQALRRPGVRWVAWVAVRRVERRNVEQLTFSTDGVPANSQATCNPRIAGGTDQGDRLRRPVERSGMSLTGFDPSPLAFKHHGGTRYSRASGELRIGDPAQIGDPLFGPASALPRTGSLAGRPGLSTVLDGMRSFLHAGRIEVRKSARRCQHGRSTKSYPNSRAKRQAPRACFARRGALVAARPRPAASSTGWEG